MISRLREITKEEGFTKVSYHSIEDKLCTCNIELCLIPDFIKCIYVAEISSVWGDSVKDMYKKYCLGK